jgi:cob(I)alamin adenosyltransferase
MKIYTKTGDGGETGLFGGRRVSKADPRVEAYGAVDELNAHLGWAAALLNEAELHQALRSIQSDLLTVGADLATPPGLDAALASRTVSLAAGASVRLEALIDRWDAELPPLKHFILPGGSPASAVLHVCRAVCRRAERAVVRLEAGSPVNPEVVVYLNRLSDLLFVLARWVNAKRGVSEPVWSPPKGP